MFYAQFGCDWPLVLQKMNIRNVKDYYYDDDNDNNDDEGGQWTKFDQKSSLELSAKVS